MTALIQAYSNYRDSGISWMSHIPSHWQSKRGKHLFKRMQRPAQANDEVVTCFRDGTVTARKNRRLAGFTESLKEIGYQGVEEGDLVIHAMDAFAGAVGVSESSGKCSPVYAVCRPEVGTNASYYSYVVREMARTGWIAALARGIRERSTDFRYETFGNCRLPVPTADEQKAIIQFLSHVDRRVVRFIRAKRQLIALLNEQKQAITHNAVTRGLNRQVCLKPSGTDWLGDIPEHWDVWRLKFLADIKTGGRDTVDRKEDGQYPFFVRSQKVERIDSYSFDGEAVLTAGDGAGVAKVFHHIDGKFDYHQRVYRFSNFRRMKGRFFYHYLSSTLRYEAFRETAKSTVDSLRLPMLQNFPVVLPPLGEQDDIVACIDSEVLELDQALTRVRREIELVREYRDRLVSDVVTGKLAVRHVELSEQLNEVDDDEAAERDEPVAEEVLVDEELALAGD